MNSQFPLLLQSAEWRLLSLLLQRPCEEKRQEIFSLVQEISDPDVRAAAFSWEQSNEETYHVLLGPGGLASPREVSYAGMEDPGGLLSELETFYQAFSFSPKTEDPPDHISYETDFVGYLVLKEAYALLAENTEGQKITNSARERFLRQHLARLARGLSQKLGTVAPVYLRHALDALLKRVAHVPDLPASAPPELEPLRCGFWTDQ